MPDPTQAEWTCECRSDCCRVVVGTGRRKIVLARLAPRQIPESETAANAHLMAAAKEMYVALIRAAEDMAISAGDREGEVSVERSWETRQEVLAALRKARGETEHA